MKKQREITDEFWKCWNFSNCIKSLDDNHHQVMGHYILTIKRLFPWYLLLVAHVDVHYNCIILDVGMQGRPQDIPPGARS